MRTHHVKSKWSKFDYITWFKYPYVHQWAEVSIYEQKCTSVYQPGWMLVVYQRHLMLSQNNYNLTVQINFKPQMCSDVHFRTFMYKSVHECTFGGFKPFNQSNGDYLLKTPCIESKWSTSNHTTWSKITDVHWLMYNNMQKHSNKHF